MQEKRNCYTYLVGWSDKNMWYYGRRTAKNCSPSDLFVTYFTSSKHVKRFISQHGIPDILSIRKTFGEDAQKCAMWESRLLNKINAKDNPIFLNKTNGDSLFDATGKTNAVDAITNERLGMVLISDPRWETGEIHHIHKGKKNGKRSGKFCAKNKDGQFVGLISRNDPRYISGELVSTSKGIKQKTKPAKSKEGKSLGSISVDDPRWETGEIIHISKGTSNTNVKNTILVKNEFGKLERIPRDDKRILEHSLENPYKGFSTARCATTGKILGKIIKTDPRWETGEIISDGVGFANANSKSGELIGRVSKDDPRWKTGEIVGVTKGKVKWDPISNPNPATGLRRPELIIRNKDPILIEIRSKTLSKTKLGKTATRFGFSSYENMVESILFLMDFYKEEYEKCVTFIDKTKFFNYCLGTDIPKCTMMWNIKRICNLHISI